MSLSAPAEKIRLWREKPSVFVRELFGIEPDPWQVSVLEQFPSNPRIALLASKGVGKTALLSWLMWNFLVTRPHPKVAATAITGDNLGDNLWPEMARWQKRCGLLEQLFTWTKTRIFLNEHPETWWASARTWSRSASAEQQANTLAGLHADHLLFVLDESGGIPDSVMAAAEGGLANVVDPKKQEAHIVQAGNPTHLEGPLYRAAMRDRAKWLVVSINADPDDPMRSPRVSVEWARDQIAMYGADSPWVLVNVFGRFPPGSINALLGPDDVLAAMKRAPREEQYSFAAKILSMDVARQGDDRSVRCKRQGICVFPFKVWRNVDSMHLAGELVSEANAWGSDANFVDGTGGWGAGVIDAARKLHLPVIEVQYAGKPFDPRFYNKRAEMHFEAAEWVKSIGCLPDDPNLVAEACATTYTFKGDKMIVEPKEEVKAKLGRSPDVWDSLCQTFAMPVAAKSLMLGGSKAREVDPFAGV